MNTLKTIITATILLFALTATQQAQAQTKEETLEWLKTNGRSLIDVIERHQETTYDGKTLNHRINYYISDIDEDRLIYRADWFINGKNDEELSRYIPFGDILYENIETLENKKAGLTDNVHGFYIRLNKENPEKLNGFWFYYDVNNEENAKRVLKAIMHMAKLSGAKENKQIF